MDWMLIILGIILLVVGLIGCVLPALPGPAVAYAALFMIQISDEPPFTVKFLVIMGVIMLLVNLLDYIVPIYGTKKLGGSRAGVRGSTIGLIVGVIVLPFLGITLGPFGLLGIILGPFIGAYIGETYTGKSSDQALKAATGSFIGFLTGTFIKIVYTVVVGVYFFRQVFFI